MDPMSAARETRTMTMKTIGMCVRALRVVAVLAAMLLLPTPAPAAAQTPSENGILLLAHGGSANWNNAVTDLTARVNERVPTEVAFGMATRQNIQAAIDRLTTRGVKAITAVPLFVSSHSSVITSTEYLLGLRDEAPKDLAIFAKMNHGQHGAAPAPNGTNGDGHAHHEAMAVDGTTRVKTTARIRMTKALDDHRIVSDILTSRARSISTTPESEVAILVAHGPVPADDNARWLANMKVHAGRINEAMPFARVEYLTVRDDAPEAIKKEATEEFRALVTKAVAENRRVLIVPLLLSYGGIEQGVRKRLDGLTYTIASQALMPDDRLIDWVLESASVSK
jgi:sirohydrochlorin ferrochelatase